MSDRPWMPLNIEDYLADTLHLSAAEHGAYMLLIMRYWKDGGLPADEKLIQRYSRLTSEQWQESRDIIAAFFDEGWAHRRIDAELAKASDIIEKRRAAAKAKHGSSKPRANADLVQSTSSDASVPPVTEEHSSSLRSDEARARKANPIIVMQSEVDAITAQRWVTHCEDKGKKPSAVQAEELCLVLREVRAAGGNPAEALRFAMLKGWVSLGMDWLRNNGFPFKTAPPTEAEDWPGRLKVWRESQTWGAWGPRPGERGCRVPADLLEPHERAAA